MSEQLKTLNNIRAEKISQMTSLPDSLRKVGDEDITEIDLRELNLNTDWDKLYFVLALNDGDKKYANYKLNFAQLIGMLIDSGQIGSGGTSHALRIEQMNNFTINPSGMIFSGSSHTFTIIPNPGYGLPSEIVIQNSDYNYDNETGVVQLTKVARNSDVFIDIRVQLKEYTLNTNFININADISPVKSIYTINDNITINLITKDINHQNLPSLGNIEMPGLNIVSYELLNEYTGILNIKINGEDDNPYITMQAEKSVTYYFGYTTKDTNILIFENDIPVSAGSAFTSLFYQRDKCPINYINGFDYGDGIEIIGKNDDVYIIVPQKYININNESMIFSSDNGNIYEMIAGNSGFPVIIQNNIQNQKMIYEIIYDNVNYYVLCISTEGKRGHQSFRSIGNIANQQTGIEWINTLPSSFVSSQSYELSDNIGYVNIIFGDNHKERTNSGFIITASVGTYNSTTHVFNTPDNITTIPCIFTCKYGEFTTTKETQITVKGADYGITGIVWEQNISSIETLDNITLNTETIFGIYSGNSRHQVADPSLIQFSANLGTISNNIYTAPDINSEIEDIITASYTVEGNTYTVSKNISIHPYNFSNIIWAENLPVSIFDNESLIISNIYKVNNDNTYELISNNNITINVSSGSVLGNTFIPTKVTGEPITVTLTVTYKGFTDSKQITVKEHQEQTSNNTLYYYIGQNIPNEYTNPENDLIIGNSNNITGWRQINTPYANYRSSSVLNNTIKINSINQSTTYYVIIPQDFIIKNTSGTVINGNSKTNTTINDINYDIYTFNGYEFNNKIYYNVAQRAYWYCDKDMPNFNTLSLQSEISNPGWHLIESTNFNIYTADNPIYDGGENLETTISLYDFGDEGDFYVLVPNNFVLMDASNTNQLTTQVSATVYDNISYKVWKLHDLDLQGKLYYNPD